MSHGGLGHEFATAHGDGPAGHGLLEKVSHKLGIILPLGYLLLSTVGVVFEVLLLRSFNTNFLAYAEPEDFLMAGLRHPMVLAFVAVSLLIPGLALALVRVGRRWSVWYDRWKSRSDTFPALRVVRTSALVFAAGYYFFTFTSMYAASEAQSIRAGEEPAMRLDFQHYGADAELPPVDGYLVASTGRYVFFYSKATRRLEVIPITSVRQFIATGAAR